MGVIPGVPKSLDRPQLVPDSQTHQSVVLLWDPHGLPREEFHLQRRYVGDCAKNVNWVFHNETSWISSDKMLVSGLHPYCAYKFRFVKSLTIRHYESYPESVSIQTSAHGVPSGPPYIVSVSTTAGSIHLKWAAPFFTNGPLIGYRLSWKSQDSEEQSREIAKQDHTATAEVISHLTPDTRYEVKVAAINDNGTGMSVGKNVTTQQKSEGDLVGVESCFD
ncbi:hypothetical protein CAPTEDRAFT_210984 [Capitella teleta]|uniref:Fibronectin type-III domain-containing protein n=1 Tax=Capitella teleta TaxID=283909 RepID=R7VFU6_CAPTE|nr:hypothetical protein CAPTEDRAFT_210984 [Capitella teleta]|eukprot:ELU14560.1 hypothetical protein CAPTEDRAFT_210984 [Capitella teleta]